MSSHTKVEIGSNFLGYRIEEVLGQGGMGIVYRAYDLRLKRTVALKLVTPELALDERFRERFARETELAMSLEHPNVVPIHDAGEVAGRVYLAMRLVVGTDLRSLLRAEGALEPARAVAICRQVGNALDAAHAQGLVHRDVKPSNVLLDTSEYAYLADFGLTRRLEEQVSPAGDAHSVGTPAYLAPEQIEAKAIDGRADVYSLGCVLFECLTGRTPYLGASRLSVAWAHLEEEPPSVSELEPSLSPAVDAVMRKALAKEPEDRYATCAALVDAAAEAFGLGRPSRRWSRLPGTVTFLFTDIEGSTRLLDRPERDRYEEALAEQQRILRAAFAAHEGQVVDTQGDSFFVAFRKANDAVAAAADAQRDLVAQEWPEGAQVKVRMGLHTGEPKVGGERYVGIGVHRAARIGAVGHGGQVLLSSTTKELAEEDLPPGVAIRDLGERRLKDIEQPQRLYQLVVEGLESEFGPLNTLDVELRRRRRRMYAGSALIGVVAAAIAVPVFAFGQGGGETRTTVAANSLAIIDPSSKEVVDSVENVGAGPAAIAYESDSRSLWVANGDDDTVSRVDPATRLVVRTIPVAAGPTGLAAGHGAAWIPNWYAGTVSRIDPEHYDALTIGRRREVPPWAFVDTVAIAVGPDAIWVGNYDGTVSRFDPVRETLVDNVDVGQFLTAIAVSADAVWVAYTGTRGAVSDKVARIDPMLPTHIERIPVGHGVTAIAVGAEAVWVAESQDDNVRRIDPETNATKAMIPVGKGPAALAVGPGGVWVANRDDGTVSLIDPNENKVVKTIAVGNSPVGLAFAAGSLWVTVQASAPESIGERQETARIVTYSMSRFTDPALAFSDGSWQLEYATCAKLLNYPDERAPAGSQLVPEVARSLRVSGDGKTYTFSIRDDFRFSPPSNARVTARTFKYSIERALSPKMNGPAGGFLGDVVGAPAYVRGEARHIAGVVAKGDTLTIRLTRAAGDLPVRLSLPFFCAVPPGTPITPKGVTAIPSAGPYYIASHTPQIVLERNPNYTGSRPRRLERIVYSIDPNAERSAERVKTGQADYYNFAQLGLPPEALAELDASYGPESAAARAGGQQLYVSPALTTYFLVLNTSRPLFANPKLRQAANYAIDRRALIRYRSPPGSEPTDQYLPPGIPGYRDAHIYPLDGPDLAEARRLAAGRGGRAVMLSCSDSPSCDGIAQVVTRDLKKIGIDVEVKQFPRAVLIQRVATKGVPFDIVDIGWFPDYADPFNFLDRFFNGNTIKAEGNGNLAYFDDPRFNSRLKNAAKLTGPKRNRVYGQLDVDLARNAAPHVAYAVEARHDFFSARMGCQVYQPIYGIDLGALCIKGAARD